MTTISTASSTAALQAADRTTDKSLAVAAGKLPTDRASKALPDVLRADQQAVSISTRTTAAIDATLQQAQSTSVSGSAVAPTPVAFAVGSRLAVTA